MNRMRKNENQRKKGTNTKKQRKREGNEGW